MRNAFAQEITDLAAQDERLVLCMADIGNRLFNTFRDRYPKRFLNCGVAEANMISMAAGLASEGFRPFCYTITPFVTARCLEQIRIDVCYHQMPVTIVGTGSGLSYASLGATHHSCDDMALLRAMPEMNVLAPGDALEVRASLRAALAQDQPAYVRIGKKGEPVVHEQVPALEMGRWLQLREGTEVVLLSTGNMLPSVLEVADHLKVHEGLSAAVWSCASVKPLDVGRLTQCFQDYPLVVTIEEHSLIGGFGAAVAEWRVDQDLPEAGRLLRLGTQDRFLHETHEQESAREAYGISVSQMIERISQAVVRQSQPV